MSVEVLPVNVSTSVSRVVDGYVTDLLASAPEVVEGVYLTGSVAIGDYHEKWSDIDFVTVLRERPRKESLRAIADVHDRVAGRTPSPRLDGWYLTWDDLAANRDPSSTLGLRALGPRLQGGRNWVPPALLWHELIEHGLHVHGPHLDDRPIAHDPDGARDWCLQTLENTWVPWWERNARVASAAGLGSFGGWATASGVLGVARIAYTLQTGLVTSKCGGGEWASVAMDARWNRILLESLRIRNRPDRRSLYRTPLGRRRDALAFIDDVLTRAGVGTPDRAVAAPELASLGVAELD